MEVDQLLEFLDRHPANSLEKESFPTYSNTPAPQLEFELRHTKEHLKKLKFNWLELQTRSLFLTHLMDGECWRECQTSKWTPGELKQLEWRGQPIKQALKQAKARGEDLMRELEAECDRVRVGEEEVGERHVYLRELVEQWKEGMEELRQLNETCVELPERSAEQLQALIDEQGIALEKRSGAAERQRDALADLRRLLAMHEGENAKLEVIQGELTSRLEEIADRRKGAGGERPVMLELTRWYTAMKETMERIVCSVGGTCQVEMVRPDCLLITISTCMNNASIPVYVTVDPLSGRVKEVKLGSTSSTPRRAGLKEIVEAAIEYNDLPFLTRAIIEEVHRNSTV